MKFRVLGPLEVASDGELVELGPRKQRRVLLSLLAAPGRHRTTAQLVADVWGDDPPNDPRSSLHAYVSNLRRILEPERTPGSERSVVVRRDERYVLQVADHEIDIHDFEEGWRLLARQEHAPAQVVDIADRTLALWRGEPFSDAADEEFARGTVTWLGSLRREVEEARVHALLDLGSSSQAISAAEELVARDPFDEAAQALLMLALYRSGRQAEALRAFAAARAGLVEQLGIEPGHQLQDLERRILRQDPALQRSVSPPAAQGRVRLGSQQRRFVGRDDELEMLGTLLAESRHGFRRTAVVSGEAGIGKTRLVEEVAAVATDQGDRVMWAQCEAGALQAGLWPVGMALRDVLEHVGEEELRRCVGVDGPALRTLLPEAMVAEDLAGAPLGRETESDLARYQLFDAVARVLGRLAEAAPIVFVVEDLHWSNELTAEFVAFLAGRRDRSRVAVIVTSRRVDSRVRTPQVRPLLRTSDAQLVELEGLGPDAVRELAVDAVGDVGANIASEIHRRTHGNPLFVNELLRSLDDDDPTGSLSRQETPVSLAEVILARLGGLPEQSLDLLTVGALYGPSFDVAVCAEVAEIDDAGVDVVEAAVGAGLIVDDGAIPGHCTFRHDVVRDAIASRPSAIRRAHLHAALGHILSQRMPHGHERIGEIAEHLCRGAAAGTALEGARTAREAVRASLERHDAETAKRMAEEGLGAVAKVVDPNERAALEAELLCDLADAHKRRFDAVSSQAASRKAFELARANGRVGTMARATRIFGGSSAVAPWLGYWSHAREIAAMADAALGELGTADDQHRVPLLCALAEARLDVGEPDRADELTAEALRRAQATGRQVDLLEALLHRLLYADLFETADARLELCEQTVAESRDLPLYEAMGRRGLIVLALEAADLDGAGEQLDRLQSLARRVESDQVRYQACFLDISIALLLGDLAAAERQLTVAIERFAHFGEARLDVLHLQLVRLLFEQHSLDAVEAELHARGEAHDSTSWRAPLLLMLATTGRHDEALDLLGRMPQREFERIPEARLQFMTPCLVAESLADLDDERRAAWLLPLLEGRGDRLISFYNGQLLHGWVDLPLGRLLGVVGRREEAERHLVAAERRARALGSHLFAMRAVTALAELDLRGGVAPRVPPETLVREAEAAGWPSVAAWARRLVQLRPASGVQAAGDR